MKPIRLSSQSRVARRGMTLVELMVCSVILVIGLGSTMASLTSFAGLEETQRETANATVAAREQLEFMQSLPFNEVFSRFNEDPLDDPGGAGSAPGAAFAVTGLTLRAGDADGMAGEILFPVDAANPGILREDTASLLFGMPRDLTGDGVVDAADHSGDYAMLPVRVRVEWQGVLGQSSVELFALMGAR